MPITPPRFPLRISATEAKHQFGDLLGHIACEGQRVIIHRHRHEICALVPLADLRIIELLEDLLDGAAAGEALADTADRVPWDVVKARILG